MVTRVLGDTCRVTVAAGLVVKWVFCVRRDTSDITCDRNDTYNQIGV